MAEIKGQILGMILVLSIFGAIAAVLTTMFSEAANDISIQLNETIYPPTSARYNPPGLSISPLLAA